MLATDVIDGHALVELIWASAAAGVVLSIVFSLAIVGVTRASSARRAGRGGAAALYVVLGVACGAAIAAGCVLAVVVMLDKG